MRGSHDSGRKRRPAWLRSRLALPSVTLVLNTSESASFGVGQRDRGGCGVRQLVIDNPVINSAFLEPGKHFKFTDDGITDEVLVILR